MSWFREEKTDQGFDNTLTTKRVVKRKLVISCALQPLGWKKKLSVKITERKI